MPAIVQPVTKSVPELYSRKQVAAILGISEEGVDLLSIPRIRLGHRTVRFSSDDIVTMLDTCKETKAAKPSIRGSAFNRAGDCKPSAVKGAK